jgi:hypothetical protein
VTFNGDSLGLGGCEGFEFLAGHLGGRARIEFVLVIGGRDVGHDLGQEGFEEGNLARGPGDFACEHLFGHEEVVVDHGSDLSPDHGAKLGGQDAVFAGWDAVFEDERAQLLGFFGQFHDLGGLHVGFFLGAGARSALTRAIEVPVCDGARDPERRFAVRALLLDLDWADLHAGGPHVGWRTDHDFKLLALVCG